MEAQVYLKMVVELSVVKKGADHINYSRRCKENLDEFLKKVKEIRENKPANLFEDFANVDLKKAQEMGCKIF